MGTTLDATILWRLRVAASLATALPARVLVTDGTALLLEVRRPPLPDHPARPVVPPCWFRAVVAGARSAAPPDAHPLIEAMLRAGDLGISTVLEHPGATLPGGIWRLDHHASAIHVFATGLTVDGARLAVGNEPEVVALEPGFLGDAGTGVTLVSATASGDRDREAVLDVVHSMLARCVTAELLTELGPGAPPRRPRRS